MNKTLKEAKRLHSMGFGILLLHPRNKRPVSNGWTSGERDSWKEIVSQYKDGQNIGVRLGEASMIGKNYLTCIDLDIKDPAFKEVALKRLKEIVGDNVLPRVSSGGGYGSCHLYCVTKRPFKMITVAKEKNSWEICIYSTGRQMVLPPSIHPSGREYVWTRNVAEPSDIPLMDFDALLTGESEGKEHKSPGAKSANISVLEDFTVEDVELAWLPLSDKMKDGITDCKGVEDRSGFLLSAVTALVSCGLSQNEVLSVLTNPKYDISACCYEHAKTRSRAKAAAWLYKYTAKRVFAERAPENMFSAARLPRKKKLTKEEIAEQSAGIEAEKDWRDELIGTGPKGDGPPKSCIENVVTILKNAVNPAVVKRNIFAYRDAYGVDTPWGGVIGVLIGDDDVAKIKYWMSQRFGFEPKSQAVEEGLTIIACENSFDPVRDALDALPEWDGVERLDTWLVDNFNAKGCAEYNGEIFRKWIVAMIMRVYRPGAKFDWMPIFEGPQRAGKSSFGKLLAGGEKHFLDWLPNLHDKDAALGLQGMWVIEMGELASLRKNEIEVVKGFVTRTVDKVRPPYGKRMIESERRCVFFGTTNRDTYLQDDTGNRRFKPLIVGALDFKALRRDRVQLFAEAKYLWDNKYETERTLDKLTPIAAEYEKTVHAEKMVQDDSFLMAEQLMEFRKNPKVFIDFNFNKFKLHNLFSGAVGLDTKKYCPPLQGWKFEQKYMQLAAKALVRLGAKKGEIRGHNYWKWEI